MTRKRCKTVVMAARSLPAEPSLRVLGFPPTPPVTLKPCKGQNECWCVGPDPRMQPTMAPGRQGEQPTLPGSRKGVGSKGAQQLQGRQSVGRAFCSWAPNSFKKNWAPVPPSSETSLKGLEPCLKVYLWVYCLHRNWIIHPWIIYSRVSSSSFHLLKS